MTNELAGMQPAPEGEPVVEQTNETPETNDQLHSDNLESDASQEGDGQPENNGAVEGVEPEKPTEEKSKRPWHLRRIDELTANRREADIRAAELEAELDRLRNGGEPTKKPEESIERQVARQAEQIVNQREMQKRINTWADQGTKEFGAADFNDRCNFIANFMDDKTRAEFMDTVTDPDQVADGHKVIMELANDPEEAERILSLPPKRMALALSKLSDKLAKPSAPAPKPLSKAPPPVTPIGGATARVNDRLEDPNIPMDVFADKFLKDLAQKVR